MVCSPHQYTLQKIALYQSIPFYQGDTSYQSSPQSSYFGNESQLRQPLYSTKIITDYQVEQNSNSQINTLPIFREQTKEQPQQLQQQPEQPEQPQEQGINYQTFNFISHPISSNLSYNFSVIYQTPIIQESVIDQQQNSKRDELSDRITQELNKLKNFQIQEIQHNV